MAAQPRFFNCATLFPGTPPLPAGAKERLGSLRFNHGDSFLWREVGSPAKIVSVNHDSIVVWQSETGDIERIVRFNDGFPSFVASKSGYGLSKTNTIANDGTVIFCCGREVFLWPFAAEDVKRLGELPDDPECLATSKDGQYVGILQYRFKGNQWSGWEARVWALRDGRWVGDYNFRDPYGGPSSLTDFEFTEDSRALSVSVEVSAQSGSDWEEHYGAAIDDEFAENVPMSPPNTARPKGSGGTSLVKYVKERFSDDGPSHHPLGTIRDLVVSADGRFIGASTMLWDRDEQRLATLDKPNSDDPLLCVGFVGNTLCRVFWDDEIYRFSMKTWKESPLKAYGQRFVDTGAFSEDGSVLAIGDRRQLWLNSTRGSRQKKKRPNFVFPFDVNALAFDSGRQRMIAGGCARLLIHDMSDEAKDDEIELPDAEQFLEDLGPGYVDQSVRQLAFSSDGYWLAAAHGGGIFVLDLRSRKGKAVWRRSQKRSRRALAFSPCNRFFAAALPQWSIGVWRLDTLDIATTLTGHLGEVTALTFSPKGELLSGSTDGTVLVWDQHSYADEVASRSGR